MPAKIITSLQPLNLSPQFRVLLLKRLKAASIRALGLLGHHLVNLTRSWYRVRKRAGLEDVRIHDLRRSLGSMMVQAGASLYVTQRALRHANSRTTSEVYAHLGDDPTRAAFEAVGEKVAALMPK